MLQPERELDRQTYKQTLLGFYETANLGPSQSPPVLQLAAHCVTNCFKVITQRSTTLTFRQGRVPSVQHKTASKHHGA